MIFSIILFFVITFGLGFSLVHFLIGKFENNIEKFLMSIGIGLGFFPILVVILNIFHIPLHWILFFVLGLVGPLFALGKNKFRIPKFDLRLTKSHVYIALAVLFAVALFLVYLKGASAYPYLEDDDPWIHAEGTSYVVEHKSYSRYIDMQLTEQNFFHSYIEPYPPTYDVVMGVLKQTNDSMIWNLKFFNALIIALGIVFFYFFALEFSQSKRRAIWATFIITILPCFMSHFIWAQTLGIALMFPAFYCFEKIRENNKWSILGAIITASIFLSQPSTAAFFAIMFCIYWVAKIFVSFLDKKGIFTKQNNLIAISCISGVLLSMIYWIPTLIKYGLKLTLSGVGIGTGLFTAGNSDTSGGIVYGLMDYIIAPTTSKMDQPTGVGLVVFFVLILSIILLVVNYKKMKTSNYLLTISLWMIFTFIGTEGNALPFKLFPHRFWAFMAIPVAFLVAEGFVTISNSLKNKVVKYLIFSVILLGMLWTSAYPKYVVETSHWPPGVSWSSSEELSGYISLPTSLPKGTPIFSICSDPGKLLAFDMYTPPFDVELYQFRLQIANKTIEDVYNVVKERNFKYVIIDGYCANIMGVDQTNLLLKQFSNSTRFKLASSNKAFWLFQVV